MCIAISVFLMARGEELDVKQRAHVANAMAELFESAALLDLVEAPAAAAAPEKSDLLSWLEDIGGSDASTSS
jgi:hypothetical protein